MSSVSDELTAKLNPWWQNLLEQRDGWVATHTWLVIWRAARHIPSLYNDLAAYEKNIVLWACLLHDVRKLGPPDFIGKDHIHPFKSAASVLEVFEKLKILDVSDKDRRHYFNQVLRLLCESV